MFSHYTQRLFFLLITIPAFLFSSSVWSQQVEDGASADQEVAYLQFIIDHHFAALRLTEIAAGTAEIRQGELDPDEGVSPTPGTDALEGRAEREQIRSLARKVNNRAREEILTAQNLLREWYGVEHSPQLSSEDEAVIQELEQEEGVAEFDRSFLETLSRHHYQGTVPTLNCIVGRDLEHDPLYRFCKGILETYLLEIEDMRELLVTEFAVVDFLPFAAPESDSGGENGAPDEDTAIPVAPGSSVVGDAGAGGGAGVIEGSPTTGGAATSGAGVGTITGTSSLAGARSLGSSTREATTSFDDATAGTSRLGLGSTTGVTTGNVGTTTTPRFGNATTDTSLRSGGTETDSGSTGLRAGSGTVLR